MVVCGLGCRGHKQAFPLWVCGPSRGACGTGLRGGHTVEGRQDACPLASLSRVCSMPCAGPWAHGGPSGSLSLRHSGQREGCQGDTAVRRGLEPEDCPALGRSRSGAGTGGHRRPRPGQGCRLCAMPSLEGRARPGGPPGLGSWAPEAARRQDGGARWSTGRSAGTFVGSPCAMRSRVTWVVPGAPTPLGLGPSPAAPGALGAGVRPRSDVGAPRPRRPPGAAVRVL